MIVAFGFFSPQPTWALASAEPCGILRSGWALRPTKEGEIGQLFWELAKQSELWVTIKPTQVGPKPASGVPEILLVFSVCFPGKTLQAAPSTVQLRVQINRSFVPALVPDHPDVQIVVDGRSAHNLTGPRFKHWVDSPGDGPGVVSTAPNGVIIELPVSLLQEMATARTVDGTTAGITFAMATPHLVQLEAFLKRIRAPVLGHVRSPWPS
jgi:hypothetical protein